MSQNLEIVAILGTYKAVTPDDVANLRRAKALGDLLVVFLDITGVEDIWPQVNMLRELQCVDVVMPFSGDVMPTMEAAKPKWLVGVGTPPCTPEFEKALSSWGGGCLVLPLE